MKKFISKFIIITILILSSISICLSEDKGCDVVPSYNSQFQNSQPITQEQNGTHHCICSLSCNNLFFVISAVPKNIDGLILSLTSFVFIHTSYPQVHIPLDKPPIV